MYYDPMYFVNSTDLNHQDDYVLDCKMGDVNGDGMIDYVYLIGDKPYEDSPFRNNIRLKIVDGKTHKQTIIPLKQNAGYGPTLFLGDFTKDKIDDILISIDSGGSGGYAFYYIYSFVNNQPKILFDFEKFDSTFIYEVNYKDYYKVEVISKSTNTKYILDITYKGKEYLSEIYDENGKLKEPIQGWVNPLGGLYPIDFQRDGTYELYAEQRIAGRYNADGLGYVQTSLEWKENNFVPFFQTVGIFGGNIDDQEKLPLPNEDIKKDSYEMITGTIKEINTRDGKRSLLIEDEKNFEYIFHIHENTIVIDFEELKVGQKVDIIYNGILTRSIPPQGTAIIVNGLKV
ncbi:DUF3221 domain-containing protein [Inediibacterium massiliense]|uniref:DUF3221 domain-containing protein n=1 Tax=Inediibacterium massiliense TaxID=1658111 RepID=UPI000AA05E06|nr:DUF3221 domain-containing protein [Inediibacterium massiliense]